MNCGDLSTHCNDSLRLGQCIANMHNTYQVSSTDDDNKQDGHTHKHTFTLKRRTSVLIFVTPRFTSAHKTTVINHSGINGFMQLMFSFGTRPMASDLYNFKTKFPSFSEAHRHECSQDVITHFNAYLEQQRP